jgi:hypothetical protein
MMPAGKLLLPDALLYKSTAFEVVAQSAVALMRWQALAAQTHATTRHHQQT